jgi:hypothetical protein
MFEEKPSGILSAIGGTITKRASVMTPLIVVDFIIGTMAVIIYFKDSSWFMFIFFGVSLIFTFIKYDKFSRTQPWMLSGEQIQKYGMQLTLGDNTKILTQQEAINMKPIDNPNEKNNTISDGEVKK